jgi:hypothetical protein
MSAKEFLDDVDALIAEVNRLNHTIEWYDAMLRRTCDHAHELLAEVREVRGKMEAGE